MSRKAACAVGLVALLLAGITILAVTLIGEGSSSKRDSADPILVCPDPGESLQIDGATRSVTLHKSRRGVLCALWQTTSTRRVPVARSYDSHDWEAYPGPSASFTPDCGPADTYCTLELPTPGVVENATYTLMTFSPPPARTPADEVARFMEQATFGTTRALLDSFRGVTLDELPQRLAKWVKEQQETKPTLHRSHYRRNLNGRLFETTEFARASHPCEAGTRYRRFAFLQGDKGAELTVETSNDGTQRKILSIHGHHLTVADGPIYYYDRSIGEPKTIPDGTHLICNKFGEGLYTDVRLDVPGVGCQSVWFNRTYGTPPIIFDENLHPLPEIIFDLEDKADPIAEDFFRDQSNGQEPLQTIFLTDSLNDTRCSSIGPSIAPTSENVSPVFASYGGYHWIHDPRCRLQENTLENPASDGGGALAKLLNDTSFCLNAPRTFVNEESCTLSNEPNVCTSSAVVCGSPGEDANQHEYGAQGEGGGAYDARGGPSTFQWQNQQKEVIWFHLALHAKDQLHQRMAWALSQILVVSQAADATTEVWLNYYDIFLRHATGNYKDVLKEVMYNELMGVMLTYRRNQSIQSQWRGNGTEFGYPDENFAREVMQLFSCGLFLLNQDGTQVLDESGAPIPTYGVDEVSEMARVVTGFRDAHRRGGIEDAHPFSRNRLDPMEIQIEWRDYLPKLGLLKRYVGEGYPLCSDFPEQHYLKKGATYRLLGYTSKSELQWDDSSWGSDNTAAIPSAETGSGLYSSLCNPSDPDVADSPCRYQSKVVLPDNLICQGAECEIDSVITIHVRDGVYYEYIRPPCVHRTFYENPRKSKGRWPAAPYLCADPLDAVAVPACCVLDSDNEPTTPAYRMEKYHGEKVNAIVAESRCDANVTLGMCGKTFWGVQNCGSTGCSHNPNYWTREPCQLKILIGPNRKVALVHDAPLDQIEHERNVTPPSLLRNDTKTFFGVVWSSETVVDAIIQDCASKPSCTESPDGHCLCDVTATSEPAFSELPSVDDVIGLPYGAFAPDMTERDYKAFVIGDVKVFYEQDARYSKRTIFEVIDPHTGIIVRRKNVRSDVHVNGIDGLSFKNPVQFMTLWGPQLRDAHHETDAFLEMLVQHPSTPPMIGTVLAQRFGISNPSPRYVSVFTRAFRTGTYAFNDSRVSISYGSGKYGDLAATCAAILLDRESRTSLLDADPTYGSLREPIIKLLALMRNLEFESRPSAPVVSFSSTRPIQDVIGQMVYNSPSIFSFFLPEFIPPGPLSKAGLRSPETQVQNGQSIVNALNGMSALIKYGWDSCWGGFGNNAGGFCESQRISGNSTYSFGAMTYRPTNPASAIEVVDELATVMTSGRLSEESRALLQEVFDDEEDTVYAVAKVENLLATTPEFHATGLTTPTKEIRSAPIPPQSFGLPYRAVIFLYFPGGIDSFNVLVPHECTGSNPSGMTVRQQYDTERGVLALNENERRNIIAAAGQPCSTFAVHPSLPVLKELYDDGDLSFFVNMGVLNVPVDKGNYKTLTRSQLMAHNAMSAEAGRIDPFDSDDATGVAGRMSRVLSSRTGSYQFSSGLTTVDRAAVAMDGDEDTLPIIVSRSGPSAFDAKPAAEEIFDHRDYVFRLNGGLTRDSSSMFGETWSQNLIRSIADTDELVTVFDASDLDVEDSEGVILKMIERHVPRGVDRDIFHLRLGSWDHHDDMKESLNANANSVNSFLETIMTELKRMDMWDNVTIVTASDFGRSLRPNSNIGSDHAWGGHYFMTGGSVNGGKIHGDYPTDLSASSPLNIADRGIFIPTLGWESMWNGVAQWMGVKDEDLLQVLPNKDLTGARLFTEDELFV